MTKAECGKCGKHLTEKYYEAVTCEEMKEIEKKAAEGGLSYYRMMENAGKAAADVILDKSACIELRENQKAYKQRALKKDIVVFCGRGNNGGDGYVAARELAAKGMDVTVIMADGEPKTENAIKNINIVLRRGITVVDAKKYFKEIPEILQAADIVVDAIYGTGFHGSLPEEVRKCTKLINEQCRNSESLIKKQVFSLDIPTGMNGNSGQADEDTVMSDYTIAFHRLKPVHKKETALKYCGEIIAVGIGID